ncbi:hypothetical protein VTI74DRAFT_10078 [Chaetomium olivicolor]
MENQRQQIIICGDAHQDRSPTLLKEIYSGTLDLDLIWPAASQDWQGAARQLRQTGTESDCIEPHGSSCHSPGSQDRPALELLGQGFPSQCSLRMCQGGLLSKLAKENLPGDISSLDVEENSKRIWIQSWLSRPIHCALRLLLVPCLSGAESASSAMPQRVGTGT